jgi:HEAT repeat protein
MIFALSVAVAILAGAVLVLLALSLAVRFHRRTRERRRAALAAGPRRLLLEFAAEGGEVGADDLVAIPGPAWRAAEPTAIALLGKVRGEAHRALVEVFERRGVGDAALRDLHRRGRVRRARSAQALGNLGRRDAVPDLCELLTDPQPEVRVVAVRALGRIADPAAAEPLLSALAAPGSVPSQLVAHALIQIGPTAAPALVAALRHPAPLVRVTALDALGLLGAAGAAEPVATVLAGDLAAEVRMAAATTLGKLSTRSALAPLVGVLGAAHPPALRAAAARALGDLGTPAAVGSLRELLGDGHYRVAHEAAHAMRRLGPRGLAELREVVAADGAADDGATARAVAHAREALALADIGAGATGGSARARTVAVV